MQQCKKVVCLCFVGMSRFGLLLKQRHVRVSLSDSFILKILFSVSTYFGFISKRSNRTNP